MTFWLSQHSHAFSNCYDVFFFDEYIQPRSKKRRICFLGFFAPYFHLNKTNFEPPRKLLKRRFICDQSQVSSSIRLEVIKNQRGGGQNSVLQKSSFLRYF